jgi:hypothetical protein
MVAQVKFLHQGYVPSEGMVQLSMLSNKVQKIGRTSDVAQGLRGQVSSTVQGGALKLQSALHGEVWGIQESLSMGYLW